MRAEKTARTNARAEAARDLAQVIGRGRSLDRVLHESPRTGRDGALVAELTIGSVRHWYSLCAAIDACVSRPLDRRDVLLRCLLVVGAYQLLHTRIPAYAAVSETVAAAPRIGRTSAKGLVNQVLRVLSTRCADPSWRPDDGSDPVRFDHPQWLIDRLRAELPSEWTHVLAVDNLRAPMALRVNRRRIEPELFSARLDAQGVAHRRGLTATAIILDRPQPAASLPGFEDGWFSVQDEGAQLAADVLDPRAGERVLDACAAPGGKAGACLEAAEIDLVALEIDDQRCESMRRELKRLGFDAACVTGGDATSLEWWDGRTFSRVLVDAPCSGTGTLRRHPDIKLLKHPDDIDAYRAIQSKLLGNLWRVLEPGGRLVYCTCSILHEENDAVVGEFLAAHRDADLARIDAGWGRPTAYGRLTLPSDAGPDGFYFAAVTKAARGA
jgi:16S rRNA (cytosine967-C5)-methyltransferase